MLYLHSVVCLCSLLLLATASSADEPPLPTITQERLLGHLSFLASDELEGRDTGARGGEIAALYIATQFEGYGLKPLTSEKDSTPQAYFQPFALDASTFRDVDLEIDGESFEYGKDFSFFDFTGGAEAEAELIFCGYGITAPEFDYDDYANVDVNGKFVLLLRHEPHEKTEGEFFQGLRHTRHALFAEKFRNAVRRGARGMILVNDPLHCSKSANFGVTGPRAIRGLHKPTDTKKTENGAPEAKKKESGDTAAQSCMALFASRKMATALSEKINLLGLQTKIDTERAPASQTTGLMVKARLRYEREVLSVPNVTAVLSGSDPKLRSEFVVVGGHFDHEGLQNAKIMNGANDNASGIAGMLATAEALSRLESKPARSVIFIAFNAEEKGLLGSRHYVDHPLVPLEDTIAMINMDMIGRSTGNTVEILGTVYSPRLDQIARAALSAAGVTDPIFKGPPLSGRSDHYPFFTRGVPVLVFHSDDMADYHTPNDTIEKITIGTMQRIVKAIALSTWEVANMPERPKILVLKRF